MTHLDWRVSKGSPGTPGMLLKAEDFIQGKHIFYKLSRYSADTGIIGCESVNEYLADRILSCAGIAHLNYQLIHAKIVINDKEYITYLCASEDFRRRNEIKIPFETYYENSKNENESVIQFCKRIGLADALYEMLTADFLLMNRDRHGANIEILENTESGALRLAPLYDHGFSLLAAASEEKDVNAFDITEERRVQSFVGHDTTVENLAFVPQEKLLALPKDVPWDALFSEIQFAAPDYWICQTKKLAAYRWNKYEDLYCKRQNASKC